MSTPQNPNDPNSSSAEQNLDGQNPGPGDQPESAQSASGQSAQNPQDTQFQPGQEAQFRPEQPTYQQGTYDPHANQAQGQPYQQGGYSQPGAYQQDPYQQHAYSQGAAQQQAYGQPAYGQPGYGQAPQSAPQQAGFFKSLFDIRFDNFIAVKWAGFIYIIAIVVAVLSYLGTIVAGITTGIAAGSASSYLSGGPSFSVLPLILSIIFGWIIPALWVIGVRLVLELIVSNIKTAEHTKRIADSVGR